MGKRGAGQGTIQKRRDGRWVATVHIGYEAGKRIRKSFYGATEAEVKARLVPALADHQRGLPIRHERQTVAKFLDNWLKDRVRPTVRISTYESYALQVRVHIAPELGRVQMEKLTPQRLQAFYSAKLATLAPRSVQYLHRILRQALGQALLWNLIPRNPATLVVPPRVPYKQAAAFTLDEARGFLAAIAGDNREALYVVALVAGLRRGELLGLRWQDVDLGRGTLAVRQTVMKVPGGYRFSEPKTESSRRVVKLSAMALEALARHRVRQMEDRLRAGPRWQDSGLVFTTGVGTPIDGRNLLREFQGVLERAGLRKMPLHALRHSAATLMLALGIQPKVVQEMLGHSRIAVTMDTYSHVLPHLQDEAAARMDALLGRAV